MFPYSESKKMLPAVTKTAAAMTNTINPDAMCKRKGADIWGFGLALMVYYLLDCFLFCINRKAALPAHQYAVFRFAGCCCMKDSTALPNWRVSPDIPRDIPSDRFWRAVQHHHRSLMRFASSIIPCKTRSKAGGCSPYIN